MSTPQAPDPWEAEYRQAQIGLLHAQQEQIYGGLQYREEEIKRLEREVQLGSQPAVVYQTYRAPSSAQYFSSGNAVFVPLQSSYGGWS